MNLETLKFEKEGDVGILTISRPQALNALNQQVLDEFAQFLSTVSEQGIRALIITGAGKAFVAGADIKEMENHNEEEASEMSNKGQALFQRIEDLRIPVIAAVNGFALGGGLELALACDFIIASEKAKFGLPEVSLGLIPGYGGTQRLVRAIGKPLTRFITLTGDIYSAQQFLDWGLLVKVVSPEVLLEDCKKVASIMAQRGPVALTYAKRAINEGSEKPQFEAMKLECDLFAETFTTKDHTEGIKAFIEKRSPEFVGQ